ncbi:hypothetical protein ACJZ2D_000319 [Fusarium nematophilum]
MTTPTLQIDRANNRYLSRSVQDLFSLRDRVTVITGGARGIGLAFAFACAEAGSHVAILDRLETPHEHFYKLEKEYGVKVKLYQTDVTKFDVLERTFAEVANDFKRIDGLITAAGVCPDEPFLERKPEDVTRCFSINTLGTYFAAQLTARQITKQDEGLATPKGGSLVFIASIAAHMASKGQYTSDYCSSKGAVVALATQLGCELASRGIRVNSISPGYVATDMCLSIADERPGLVEIFHSEPPMKRMGDRLDLKGAAVFLLSDASAYMTSSDMLIDGESQDCQRQRKTAMAHALILGASGISGWALVNQATRYPEKDTFSRITGTTNRPLTAEQARLPNDPRINLVSGIDFTRPVDEVVPLLKEKIPDIHTTDDFESLNTINTNLLEVAVRAVEATSPKLQSFILQTGGKGYGMQFPKESGLKAPLHEDLPRIPEPWASKVFYYPQVDLLKKLSQGKSWTFTEIRPDGIVGFTPVKNPMNMSQGIGIYLTLFREVYGTGATVPFPGREHGYHATHSDTFQDILAKMEIYAAIHSDKCGNGRAFNIADGETVTWAHVWPHLCAHFHLVGKGPVKDSIPMEQFVREHRDKWVALAKKHGVEEGLVDRQGWFHTQYMLVDFDYDRQFDLSRARSVGFTEEIDTVQGYFEAWERMRAAKQLPPLG